MIIHIQYIVYIPIYFDAKYFICGSAKLDRYAEIDRYLF
jgi:hypothetical protein